MRLALTAATLFATLPLPAGAMPIAPTAGADALVTSVDLVCSKGFHFAAGHGCVSNSLYHRPRKSVSVSCSTRSPTGELRPCGTPPSPH